MDINKDAMTRTKRHILPRKQRNLRALSQLWSLVVMGCFGKRCHKKKENKYQRPAATGGAYPTNKAYRSGAGKDDYSGNKDGGMVIMTNMIAGTAAATDFCGSTCGGGSSACDGGGGGGGC